RQRSAAARNSSRWTNRSACDRHGHARDDGTRIGATVTRATQGRRRDFYVWLQRAGRGGSGERRFDSVIADKAVQPKRDIETGAGYSGYRATARVAPAGSGSFSVVPASAKNPTKFSDVFCAKWCAADKCEQPE